MIYKNAELYNVSELERQCDGSYSMLRLPRSVEMGLSERGQMMNRNCCGNEIRFNLNSGKAKIKLKIDKMSDAIVKQSRALLYYGSIAAGWTCCVKDIYEQETVIEIERPDHIEWLEKISAENKYPFDPNLIRLVFDNLRVNVIDIEGDIEPPRPDQTPGIRYLAYGSSITHGSLGLLATNTYAAHTARLLNADLINLGFAGTARLEKSAADYIASGCGWDFATLEMGINILEIDPEEYRKRITYFISTVAKANPEKKVFCIDVFYCDSDLYKDGRAKRFREIMKETVYDLNVPNTVYINGLDIMGGSFGLSADFVHPNNSAIFKMGEALADIIKRNL